MTRLKALLGALLLAASSLALAETQLTAAQAKDHVGETTKVCGTVASARYAPRSKGAPTFLNLDERYPDQIFTIVIWGRDRSHFPTRPESLVGAPLCVSGLITSYRNMPEMVISDPTQMGR